MSTVNGKHIMISYAWEGGRRKVDQISREFRSAGIPIWMDTRNGLGEDLLNGMAEAVEDSLAICCFITPEYQESKYCQMELKYANDLNKPIIPCFITDFQPRKWLGILVAGLIRYNFSDDVNDAVLDPLIRYIKQDILQVQSTVSLKPPPVRVRIEAPFVLPEQRLVLKTTVETVNSNKHVCKTAVGTVDLHEEQSLSSNYSSSGISPKMIANRKPSTHTIRSDMSDLLVNQSIQGLIAKFSRVDQQKSRNNESQDSQRYKQYL